MISIFTYFPHFLLLFIPTVWLGVAPEVQRFGVGKRLFNAFHDLMVEDGCRIIMIDTQADNVPARKFFERAGFGSLESHVYFRYVKSRLSVVAEQQQKEEEQWQEQQQQVIICLQSSRGLNNNQMYHSLSSSLPPSFPPPIVSNWGPKT